LFKLLLSIKKTAIMADVSTFDPTLKKKKKKKPSTKDKSDEVAEVTEELEELEVKDEAPKKEEAKKEEAKGEEPEDPDAEFDFGAKKKKTKKKSTKEPKEAKEPVEEEPQETPESDETSEPTSIGDGSSWAGSDRDYTYEELAGRVYNLMHSNNPELGSSTKRYQIKPPQVCREGTKKTVWLNFAEICPMLKRKPEHVLNYVLAELGTNGSLDGKLRLVIKGRFQPKQIENVLRHYISEYVACRTCKSPDTNLKKENRLYFLCCETCGSTRSVAAIKKGFEAQIGKRKKEEK